MYLNHFAVHPKLIQHCKSTILLLRKLKRESNSKGKKKEWRQKGGDQVENESFFLMSLFLSLPRRQGDGETGDIKRERKLRNYWSKEWEWDSLKDCKAQKVETLKFMPCHSTTMYVYVCGSLSNGPDVEWRGGEGHWANLGVHSICLTDSSKSNP